jgi:hypothetical protein
MYGFVQYQGGYGRTFLGCLVVASVSRRAGVRHPAGHFQIGDGHAQIMPENVLRVLLAQVAMVRVNCFGIGRIGAIKNADRKCNVPRRYGGTLDPLTLMVKGEHLTVFTSWQPRFSLRPTKNRVQLKIEMIRRGKLY